MRLSAPQALARLAASDHGYLSTVDPQRGVNTVPVVYVIDDTGHVGIPVDRVKPKAPGRLARERNLETDPRAVLLADHWDRDDWSALWWVKAELRCEPDDQDRAAALSALLAGRYPQYRQEQTIARVLQLRIVRVTGWAATSA